MQIHRVKGLWDAQSEPVGRGATLFPERDIGKVDVTETPGCSFPFFRRFGPSPGSGLVVKVNNVHVETSARGAQGNI